MYPYRHLIGARGPTQWRVFLCLAVLAVLWRAVIPMGYMPDLSAARNGVWVLTVCTASGEMATVSVDLGGQAGEPRPDMPSGSDCPFGLMAGQDGCLATSSSLFSSLASGRVADVVVHRAAPALPPLGPPLGARAPPSNPA